MTRAWILAFVIWLNPALKSISTSDSGYYWVQSFAEPLSTITLKAKKALLNDLQLPFSFQLLKADKGFGIYLSMCWTSVVFADVRGTQNRCLCAFRDAFLKQGERKREKPLFPFLALLFSCVSNTLCAWFCLNPKMANNHTPWKLPTSSHPSLWFVFFLLAIDIWEPAETKWCETWRSDRGVYSGSVCVKPRGAMKFPSVPLLALLFQA